MLDMNIGYHILIFMIYDFLSVEGFQDGSFK